MQFQLNKKEQENLELKNIIGNQSYLENELHIKKGEISELKK